MSKKKKPERLDPRKNNVACTYVLLDMNYPRTMWDIESFLWYLYHEECEVFIDKHHEWYVAVPGRCEKLGKDGRCGAGRRQPLVCGEFSDYPAKRIADLAMHHFKTERELLGYLREHRPRLFAKLSPVIRAVAEG